MASTLAQSDTAAAVMFTNNLGQVIYVDQAFLDLMQYPEAGVVTGEPLFKALRLDIQSGKGLLDTVRQNGNVEDKVLEIPTAKGALIRLSVNASASHDAQGNFIGADITLRKFGVAITQIPATAARPAEVPAMPTNPVIPAREVSAEATFADNNQFLQLYFMTQIKGVYVLYQRVIGLMARDRLDKIINQTAQKNGWSLQIRNGLFTSDLVGTTAEMYRALLREVIAFGVRMVGERLIAREIDNIDQQMHEGVRVLAQQNGLYQLYRQK